MTQARLQQIVKMVTVIACIVLFALISVVGYQYIKIGTLSKKETILDNKIADLSVTQASLEEGIEIRSTDAYVEQQARENLGMIKIDGEVVYIAE